jgi:hypothetical protein
MLKLLFQISTVSGTTPITIGKILISKNFSKIIKAALLAR